MAVDLVQEIGRRITDAIEDSRETTFLFQRLSWPSSRGMRSPSRTRWSPSKISLQPLNCLVSEAYRLCAGGQKNNNNKVIYKTP